jgi:hypothetical protein
MPAPATALTVDLARARAFWFQRQGLAAPAAATEDLASVVARTGWIRTLGGADVYLAARARVAGLSRATMDAAVAASQLRVIPSVRGCIYLVPGADVPWVLRIAEEAWRPRAEREVEKAGATWHEVEDLAKSAKLVLRKGPLGTDAIRRAVPEGSVRSLGEQGKKIGMSSLLPMALRLLEFEDKIERTLDGGRLDTERYTWRIVKDAPASPFKDTASRWTKLAEVFFGQAGPATLAHFATWAGLAQRDARTAIAKLDVVPVTVEGMDGEALVLARDVDALKRAKAPDSAALLSFEDNYLTFHGGPAVVTDAAHHDLELAAWGADRPQRMGDIAHPAMRTVVIGGVVVGLWELDEANGHGVWAPLSAGAIAPKHAAKIDALIADTARFLQDELGHARSFTLDTAELVAERAAKIEAMRAPRTPSPRPLPKASASAASAARSSRAAPASASRSRNTKPARPRSRA